MPLNNMTTDCQLWLHKKDVFTGFMEEIIFGFLAFKESFFEVNHRLILASSFCTIKNSFLWLNGYIKGWCHLQT